mgnify:CR=1 FL=1|jgi:hypothetical protein
MGLGSQYLGGYLGLIQVNTYEKRGSFAPFFVYLFTPINILSSITIMQEAL